MEATFEGLVICSCSFLKNVRGAFAAGARCDTGGSGSRVPKPMLFLFLKGYFQDAPGCRVECLEVLPCNGSGVAQGSVVSVG